MTGMKTLLSEHVESLLPKASAAACIRPSEYCTSRTIACYRISGYIICSGEHRYCHISCHGKTTGCGPWYYLYCSS